MATTQRAPRHKSKIVDYSSDHDPDNESFIKVGTPFPDPVDRRRGGQNTFAPLWKQEVLDERGRRRLHGAFRGGFSAGYFNTVGSKEGWTPSQFVSSRTNRAQPQQGMRPEDFMDEEDLMELRESQEITTAHGRSRMEGEAYEEWKGEQIRNDSQRGGILGDLAGHIIESLESVSVAQVRNPLGARLMGEMGWKEGTRLGSSRIERRRRNGIGGEGVTQANAATSNLAGDQQRHRFVPRGREAKAMSTPADTRNDQEGQDEAALVEFEPKNDRRGLGYGVSAEKLAAMVAELGVHGERGQGPSLVQLGSGGESGGKVSQLVKQKKKKSKAAKVRTNRLSFGGDMVEDDEEDSEMGVLLGITKKPSRKAVVVEPDVDEPGTAISAGSGPRKPISLTLTGGGSGQIHPLLLTRKMCMDGTAPLSGFIVSATTYGRNSREDWFEGPKVPDDFDGRHHPSQAETADDGAARWQGKAAKFRRIFPEDRADVFGECDVAKVPSSGSVIDYLRAKDQERLQRAAASVQHDDLPVDSEEQPEFITDVTGGETNNDLPPGVHKIPKSDAENALRGFIPFCEDPAKQSRYREYLELCAGHRPKLEHQLPSESDQRMREYDEFYQAARIFHPISAAMSSRFTSGGSIATQLQEDQQQEQHQQVQQEREQQQSSASDKEKAAAAGMFGPMTRTVVDWEPARLVCKRMNLLVPKVVVPTAVVDAYLQGQKQQQQQYHIHQPVLLGSISSAGGGNLVAATSDTANALGKRQSKWDRKESTAIPPAASTAQSKRRMRAVDFFDIAQNDSHTGTSSGGGNQSGLPSSIEVRRPDMAIFEAIFNESSEDDDS